MSSLPLRESVTRGKRALLIVGLALISGPILLMIEAVGRDSQGDIETGGMLEFAAIWVVGFVIVLVGVLAWLVIAWAAPDDDTDAGEN